MSASAAIAVLIEDAATKLARMIFFMALPPG
jgi:hypothetical protein